MKIMIAFAKESWMRFIGHLDLVRVIERAIRRAGYDLTYSSGFHPQPVLSISRPLSLGLESESEYLQVELNKEVNLDQFLGQVNKELPKGLRFLRAQEGIEKSLDSKLFYCDYIFDFSWTAMDEHQLNQGIGNWLAKDSLIMPKKKKKGKKKIWTDRDIRPLIHQVVQEDLVLFARLRADQGNHLKALDFLTSLIKEEELSIDSDAVIIRRIAQRDKFEENIF